MTIYHTRLEEKNIMQEDKVIELDAIGKQYRIGMARNYTKADFNEFWSLRNVTLDILRGQVLGIIGRNGAGKTTLLNIIAKVLSPTEGKVSVAGKVLGLFNLGTGFQDELTGRENIFLNGAILGASHGEIENKLELIIKFSELGDFINMPLGSYSQGMRLRLGFSIVVNLDFDILVIDEILAVGDNLFQQKCFQQLMDFKRAGKTIIITTQSLDLIQRLCTRAALLDHGLLLFCGEVDAAINKYRALLNTEKFFVGPVQRNAELVKNTKKWADNTSEWGTKSGAKEVMIDSVEFIDKFGRFCSGLKCQDPLKIKIYFTARNAVKEPHFGVAIFREDGVYCYGPNTVFDGFIIPELKEGRGYFILNFKKVLLNSGAYRISVAIWDKNETVAFDHHYGCYKLAIEGGTNNGALLNIPFYDPRDIFARFIYPRYAKSCFQLTGNLDNNPAGDEDIDCVFIKLTDHLGAYKVIFMTGESVTFCLGTSGFKIYDKNYCWRVGIYRDDGILCQDFIMPAKRRKYLKVFFPKLSLLPGSYSIALGLMDIKENKILAYRPNVTVFHMVFTRQDHGTVYLEHKWEWRLPS